MNKKIKNFTVAATLNSCIIYVAMYDLTIGSRLKSKIHGDIYSDCEARVALVILCVINA